MSSHPSPDTNPAQALRVIIPCRNEAQALPALLQDLAQQHGIALRVTIVDGGSQDATVARARAASCEVLQTTPGRGHQMNRGWQQSNEPALLFLHADSRLPSPTLLRDAWHCWWPQRNDCAGHFRLQFIDTPDPKPFFYRHLEAKTALNKPQSFNGDQGLLIHRPLLESLGGFDESLPFLEDQALGTAIRQQARFITLPGTLQTSARRFETEGRRARYFAMLLIMCAREAGCTDFLQAAPGLYREQSAAGPLQVGPLLERLVREAEQRPESWAIIARYLRENAWQLPALLDSASAERWQLRQQYERWLEPRLRNWTHADGIIAGALRLGFGRLAVRGLRRR